MAYSMWVMLERKRLPTVRALADAVEASEFPMSIDSDWDWTLHSGWLPITWQGVESGCEVDFDALEPGDTEAAAAAGHAGLDAVVVLTTRGWDSLKVANAFAACLVEICGGVISEDEDDYRAGDDAIRWARKGIEDAERGEKDEAKRAAARDRALADGDLEGQLTAVLAELAGQTITKFMLFNDRLAMYTADGYILSCGCWRLHGKSRVYDVTRFRTLKQKETDRILSEENWQAIAEAMEPELDEAGELDSADMEAAFAALQGLAGTVDIVEARWKPPHTIEVELSADGKPVIEYVGAGYVVSITVRSPDIEFNVSDQIRIF